MLLECHLLGKEERGCLCFNFKIEPKEKKFLFKRLLALPEEEVCSYKSSFKKVKNKVHFLPLARHPVSYYCNGIVHTMSKLKLIHMH